MDNVGTTGVGVGVGIGIGVDVGVGVGSGVGDVEGNGVAIGDGIGAALIATPLFHTSFLPDLTQVNFLPEAVAVAPALVHFAPAFTAAKVGAEIRDKDSSRASNTRARVMR
jgi:hypothetical protein